MSADTRELHQLANAMAWNTGEAERQMTGIVMRGALNVKNQWRANAQASAGRHARLYPYSVSYDPLPMPGGASAEIGPDKDKPQGALGNILEYGTSRQGGHNDGGRALIAELPRFEAQVVALTVRLGRL
ncbi:hypothetical protein KQY30_20130 [Streptomyces sp. GMY02]|uniref:hypothetical protein n=1 Tax=Streptomyces sp. GMY02 TaxID=1333528 RepID=UPI001C2C1E2C|nr:hypothetical protein [Streptomyces sp. GMY02]QXE36207.1 hypothetical protein KQY30_20130 [Streptomyces sp. GMY02]